MADISVNPKSLLWVAKLQRNFAYLQDKQNEHIANVETRLAAAEAKARNAETKAGVVDDLMERISTLESADGTRADFSKSLEQKCNESWEKMDDFSRAVAILGKRIDEQRTVNSKQDVIMAKVRDFEQHQTELSTMCKLVVNQWKQIAPAIQQSQLHVKTLLAEVSDLKSGKASYTEPQNNLPPDHQISTGEFPGSLAVPERDDSQVMPSVEAKQVVRSEEPNNAKCNRCLDRNIQCNGRRPCSNCKRAHARCFDSSLQTKRIGKQNATIGRDEQPAGVEEQNLDKPTIRSPHDYIVTGTRDHRIEPQRTVPETIDKGFALGGDGTRNVELEATTWKSLHGPSVQVQMQPVNFESRASTMNDIRRKRKRKVREMQLSPE